MQTIIFAMGDEACQYTCLRFAVVRRQEWAGAAGRSEMGISVREVDCLNANPTSISDSLRLLSPAVLLPQPST